ncbi:MAG: CBS domain-containing protein [Caldisericota bacterium]|jgi:magnesium transporter|nr:CBS domain-containing protein [Caldisericota bacterium]
MFYLSNILGMRVLDRKQTVVGSIADLEVATGEKFPVVVAVIVRTRQGLTRVSWHNVRGVGITECTLKLAGSELLPNFKLEETSMLLLNHVLDKQIVDVHGAKVVRVNDVELAESHGQLRVIAVDAGFRSFMRRAGLSRLVSAAEKVRHHRLSENSIPWSFVNPLGREVRNVQVRTTWKELSKLHPSDLADVVDDLDFNERDALFKALNDEQAADTLAELEDDRVKVSILERLGVARAADILEEMDPDDAADILQDARSETKEAVLNEMEPEEREDVRELLAYDEDTAGGLMTNDYLEIREEMTAGDIISLMRREAPDTETIYYLYVTDDTEHLVGILSLRALIVADPSVPASSIMHTRIISVFVDDPKQKVAEMINKYSYLALPVVNHDNVLQGIVTVHAVIDQAMES